MQWLRCFALLTLAPGIVVVELLGRCGCWFVVVVVVSLLVDVARLVALKQSTLTESVERRRRRRICGEGWVLVQSWPGGPVEDATNTGDYSAGGPLLSVLLLLLLLLLSVWQVGCNEPRA